MKHAHVIVLSLVFGLLAGAACSGVDMEANGAMGGPPGTSYDGDEEGALDQGATVWAWRAKWCARPSRRWT